MPLAAARFRLASPAATAAALAALGALSACSAGQISETAYMHAAVPGVSQNFTVNGDTQAPAASIALRNMLIVYGGVNGYPAGGGAPLQLSIFNNTPNPIKVTMSAPEIASGISIRDNPTASGAAAAASAEPGASASAQPSASASASVSAQPSASVSGQPSASASASATASASAQASAPASAGSSVTVVVPVNGFATFGPHSAQSLVLSGLKSAIQGGGVVNGIRFRFETGQGLQLQEQPVAPAPGASPVNAPCVFESDTAVCRAPVGVPVDAPPRAAPVVTGAGE
ncbi:hypothetical protein [Hamadaea tsunoensis]|uniref:hypothetical protein n=1 Tax=Hamadaea tsunoensis TaxID=53368 RepID=UPI00068792A5|nr:hypothetical protein [Hamadaea tsunoensis]